MNAYRFNRYPSNSAVASGITMMISVWFLVAAGAILTDPASPYTQRVHAQASALARNADASRNADSEVAIAPEAHLTITVEARRSAEL